MRFYNKIPKNKAFTLVELLVTIGVFSTVIGMVSGIFILGLRQQRLAFAGQAVLDQASFAVEYMGRVLRMAKKELAASPTCLSQRGLNYEVTRSGSGIKFINHLEGDDCQEFFLESTQLKYRKKIGLAGEETLFLTSDKLEISTFKFNLAGGSQSDNVQPKVTVFMEIKGKGDLEGSRKMKIQTAVSQRNLDVLQ